MKRIACMLAFAVIFQVLTACAVSQGTVSENFQETGGTLSFAQWSAQTSHVLFLHKNDALQVEMICESGEIALDIRGENGCEAYTGKGLETGLFTVKAPEADKYIIQITGKNATGRLVFKKLSSPPVKEAMK